eukprot:jgi/Botrbrau1/14175/Bobra.182_3s0112.2
MSGLSFASNAYDYESQGDANAKAWKRGDISWDPFRMEADPVKAEKGAVATRAAPTVNTRSSNRAPREVAPGPPTRGKGPFKCQVESCQTSLEGGKEYHVRYRICEKCLKLNEVLREGRKERFCQQCGRFHTLDQFDGDKRSCRARLQRHNTRRRKNPQKSAVASKRGDKPAKAGKSTGVSTKKMKVERPLPHDAFEEVLENLLSTCEPSSLCPDFSGGSTGSAQEYLQDGTSGLSTPMDDTSMYTDDGPFHPALGDSDLTESMSMNFMDHPSLSLPEQVYAFPTDQGTQDILDSFPGMNLVGSVPQFEQPRHTHHTTSLSQQPLGQHTLGLLPQDPLKVPLPDLPGFDDFASLSEGAGPRPASHQPGNHSITGALHHLEQLPKGYPGNGYLSLGTQPAGSASVQADSYAIHWVPVHRELHVQQQPSVVVGVPMQAPPSGSEYRYINSGLLQTNSKGTRQVAMLQPLNTLQPSLVDVNNQPMHVQLPHQLLPQQQLTQQQQQLAQEQQHLNQRQQQLAQQQQQLTQQRLAQQQYLQQQQQQQRQQQHLAQPQAAQPAHAQQTRSIASALDSLVLAKAIISNPLGVSPLGVYDSGLQHSRMSTKLNGVTPSQLPRDLKMQFQSLLGADSMEAYIRPGCVHLILKYSVAASEGHAQEGKLSAREAANWLLDQPQASTADIWHRGAILVQVHDEVALIREGKVTHVLDGQASAGVFPSLERVSPLAVLNNSPDLLTLHGANLAHTDNIVLGYCQGMEVYEKAVPKGQPAEALQLNLGSLTRNGAVQLYVVRGCFQTRFKPVLMVDNPGVVEEIKQLEDAEVADSLDIDAFLLDLDSVLELIHSLEADRSHSNEILRPYSEDDMATVFKTACRIFVYATTKGWPNVARMVAGLFDLLKKDISIIIATMHACGKLYEWTLLHLAVLSRNPLMVDMLLEWSSQFGCSFGAAIPGPKQLTPMHLAVLLKDGGAMVAKLTASCPDYEQAWKATTFDGLTAYQMAVKEGIQDVVREALRGVLAEKAAAQQLSAEEECETDEESLSDYEVEDEFGIDPETGEVMDLDGICSDMPDDEEVEAPMIDSVQEAQTEEEKAPAQELYGRNSMPSVMAESSRGSFDENVSCLKSSKDVFEIDDSFDSPFYGKRGKEEISRKDLCQAIGLTAPEFMDPPVKGDPKRLQALSEGQVVSTYGMGVAPTVFDRLSASRSAILISSVGITTLFFAVLCGQFYEMMASGRDLSSITTVLMHLCHRYLLNCSDILLHLNFCQSVRMDTLRSKSV